MFLRMEKLVVCNLTMENIQLNNGIFKLNNGKPLLSGLLLAFGELLDERWTRSRPPRDLERANRCRAEGFGDRTNSWSTNNHGSPKCTFLES